MPAQSLLRKSWPKIRIVKIKGQKLYLVDARRKGINSKREYFSIKAEAEARAAAIEADFAANGTEGLALPSDLRVMAINCTKILEPFGKNLNDATAFYKTMLEAEQAKAESKLVGLLAKEWLQNKKNEGNRQLKQDTLNGICKHAQLLERVFGDRKLLEITAEDMQHYLNSLNVSQRRKYNIRSLTSQFFNWCIKRNYTTFNPASKIEITVPRSDIAILAPDEAAKFLKTCEDEFPDLTPYVAISLFAGLRPTECALLKWENIHLDEMQITVRHDTSKVSETRNVPIEENLCRWIGNYKVDTKGFVTKQKGLRNRLQRLRMKMGYKLNGVNPDGPSWKEDTFRHSYASYWLGRNKDRAHLAENMGNSINVIKSHYKQIVSTTDTEAFWGIVPAKALTNQYKIETVQRILAKKLERYSKTEQ